MRYLELDVRILTDVFEEFRRMSLREDELYPVHFVSLPDLSFMSAFEMTKESIHQLQDRFMYSSFEQESREGIICQYTSRSRTRGAGRRQNIGK